MTQELSTEVATAMVDTKGAVEVSRDEAVTSDGVPAETETPSEKYLTEAELEKLEKGALLRQLRKVEEETLKLRTARVDDQVKILELQKKITELQNQNLTLSQQLLETEKSKLQKDLAELNRKAKEDEDYRKSVRDSITVRTGVTGNFGYNPETLLIVEK